MKKTFRIIITLVLFVLFFYVVGPRPPKPVLDNTLPKIIVALDSLDQYVHDQEKGLPVKPDNESKVVWANDSLKNQTEYCLLYLHGFSASGFEGYPTHVNFAKHFHFNAYIPRLASHGLDVPEPLLDMTPDRLYDSAKKALQIAHLLGKKVIIMSTSTGGTLSLKMAAEFPDKVDGLILFSPNIRINNPAAFMLSKPWGLQIGRLVNGGKYRYINKNLDDKECQYWNCYYRMEATVYLQQLIESTMQPELFKRVKTPVFLGYYYKDEEHQDPTVRVDAMLKMYEELGTPDKLKQKQAFDAGVHVIGCSMFSKTQPEVQQASIDFAQKILGIQP